jgi:hypothetical protein
MWQRRHSDFYNLGADRLLHVLSLGSTFAIFAGWYYRFPKMVPIHHHRELPGDVSSAAFITNIAESNFRHAQPPGIPTAFWRSVGPSHKCS